MKKRTKDNIIALLLGMATVGLTLLLAYGIEANHLFTPFFENLQ